PEAIPQIRRHGAEIARKPAPFIVGHEIEAITGRSTSLGDRTHELLEPPCPVLFGKSLKLRVDGLVQLPRQQDRCVPIDVEDSNDGRRAEQRKIGQRQAKGGCPEELSERSHGWCSRRRGPCAGGCCRNSCRFWTGGGKCGRR